MLEKSERPWGRYEVLQESHNHKVKCIWVNPGKRLSYQRHQKRAEHWFIVSGQDRKSTRLNSSHSQQSRMPSSA